MNRSVSVWTHLVGNPALLKAVLRQPRIGLAMAPSKLLHVRITVAASGDIVDY